MTQIARCDWLPERARWSHLVRSGLPAVSRKKNFPENHIINPLLTKFVRSRWLDIACFFSSLWKSTSSRSINTQKKNSANIYPAFLTAHLVNKPYIFSCLNRFSQQPGHPPRNSHIAYHCVVLFSRDQSWLSWQNNVSLPLFSIYHVQIEVKTRSELTLILNGFPHFHSDWKRLVKVFSFRQQRPNFSQFLHSN